MSEKNYWDAFYSSWTFRVPSQFAALVASEYLNPGGLLLDFGCGNGRDSIFFHKYGFKVLASDRSDVAIKSLRAYFHESDDSPDFQIVDYSDTKDMVSYLNSIPTSTGPRLYYARFLLHSLDAKTLHVFIETIAAASRTGDRIAFEFRTDKDDRLSGKTSAEHYRRGVKTHDILRFFASSRFEVLLHSEGFGYAVHKSDDAYVSRLIISVNDFQDAKAEDQVLKPGE